MVPILFPFPMFQYVKKEDFPKFLVLKRKIIAFVLFSVTLVLWIMYLAIYPKITTFYYDLRVPVPEVTKSVPYVLFLITLIHLTVGAFFLNSVPNKKKVEKFLSKYKKGEMINPKNFGELKMLIYIVFLLGISVGFMIIAFITPIYSLINSF